MTAPLTLSYRDTWEAIGISRAAFYRALRTGALDHLRAPYPAHHKFSRAKVQAFIDGRTVTPMAFPRSA